MDIEFLSALFFGSTFFFLFFYLIFRLIKRNYDKIIENWKNLAKHLKLNLEVPKGRWSWILGKYPSINGSYRDFKFNCFMYTKGSGKNQTIYTSFSFLLDKNNHKTLILYKEGFFSKIGKLLGGQDIQIGHEDFDKSFIVKSNDEMFAKRILNSRIRQLLLRKTPKLRGEFTFDNNTLSYNEIIVLNNERNRLSFQTVIEVATELAKELQEN